MANILSPPVKSFASLLVLVGLPIILYAQSNDIVKVKSKYMLFKNGSAISKLKFDTIRASQNGLYACLKNKKWGIIDESGNLIIPNRYLNIRYFSKSLVAVQSNRFPFQWGLIDRTAKIIVPMEHREIKIHSAQYALLRYGHMPDDWKLVDGNGKTLFKRVEDFRTISNNRAIVKDNEDLLNQGYFYIDSNAKVLTPILKEKVILDKEPKVVIRKSDYKKAYMNLDCSVLTDWYDDIMITGKEYDIAKIEHGKVIAIHAAQPEKRSSAYYSLRYSENVLLGKTSNSSQEFIIGDFTEKPKGPYFFIREFENGIAIVAGPEKIGNWNAHYFISATGEKLSQSFIEINPFRKKPSVVRRFENQIVEYAYADEKGRVFSKWYPWVSAGVNPNFVNSTGGGTANRAQKAVRDLAELFSGIAFLKALKGNGKSDGLPIKYEYIHRGSEFFNNRAIISLKGTRYTASTDSGFYFTDNARFGYIDSAGVEIIPCRYQQAWDFQNGYAKVKRDNKVGVINTMGIEVIPIIYDALLVHSYSDGIIAKKDSKWGVLDFANTVLLPFEYDGIERYSPEKIKVKREGLWYYVNSKGEKISE